MVSELTIPVEKSENHFQMIVRKEVIESAIREAIVRLHPEYAKDWLINPYFSIGDAMFVGTKL